MKLIACAILGFGLGVLPALSADNAAKAPKAAATLAGKPAMGVNGRFHQLHEKKELLECSDCHDKVQTDILYLRKDDRLSPKLSAEGQVDRKGCLTCHKPGDKAGKTASFWGV